MSFNADWNVDQYKTEHECDDHWELRRSFMMAHKDKFEEDQLVCLAQVFTNIEFLGCRYPAETMQLVSSLSQGVADDYREKQKGRLQRTFIQASDAAGAKAKGLKRPLQEEGAAASTSSASTQQQKKIIPDVNTKSVVTVNARLENNFTPKSQGGSSKLAQVTYGPSIYPASQSQNSVSPQSVSSANNGSLRFDSSRYGGVKTYHIDQSSAGRPPRTTGPEIGGPFGKLVLIEPANEPIGAMQTIQNSAAMCQVPLCFEYGQEVSSEVSCNVYVNGKLLASSCEENKKLASRAAAEEGLKKLRETCYTIKTKLKFLSDTTIDKSLDITSNSNTSNSNTEFADINVPVSDSNVGSRLLRLMGWSGGGLGKNAQGIEEPVRIQEHVNRAGLGLSRANSGGSGDRQFRDQVYRLMQDYAKRDSEYDLVFSSDFTIEERKTMHLIATRLKLKTKSYGKDEGRHMVVFKKRDMWETLEQLLRSSGSTERYDLIKPTGLAPSTFQ